MLIRARLAAALATLLLDAAACAAPAAVSGQGGAAAQAQALIIGGGVTRAEGEAWLARWEKAYPLYRQHLVPLDGYPKVVRSDDVPGLKPGFHVVLIGICGGADAASRLELAKTFFPGTYARPVDSPAACPSMPLETTVAAARTLKKDGNRLVVNLYFAPATEESDPEGVARARAAKVRGPGSYTARAAVIGPDELVYGYAEDKFFASERDSGTGIRSTCTITLSAAAAAITLDATCDDDEPLPCSDRISHIVTRTTYRFDGTRLDVKTDVLEEKRSKLCD